MKARKDGNRKIKNPEIPEWIWERHPDYLRDISKTADAIMGSAALTDAETHEDAADRVAAAICEETGCPDAFAVLFEALADACKRRVPADETEN